MKLHLQQARPGIAGEPGIEPREMTGMHRDFEVVPGVQAQVDWGDEAKILSHMGIVMANSFHMTLSYSRDPFCCFNTGQDLQTFFDCHRRGFVHFGGVPMTIVYLGVGRERQPSVLHFIDRRSSCIDSELRRFIDYMFVTASWGSLPSLIWVGSNMILAR